jgi:hypothetical protein
MPSGKSSWKRRVLAPDENNMGNQWSSCNLGTIRLELDAAKARGDGGYFAYVNSALCQYHLPPRVISGFMIQGSGLSRTRHKPARTIERG